MKLQKIIQRRKTKQLQVIQTQIEGADKRELETANIRDRNKTDTNKTAVDETDTVAVNRHSCRRGSRIFCREVSQQQTM